MMKTLLLLACVVFVSGSPVSDSNSVILKEMVNELNQALHNITQAVKDCEGNTIYLKDLKNKYKHCTPEYFCGVEHELKKVSSLSGAKFEYFRSDKMLMRNLNMYNKRPDEKNGCPYDENVTEEIPLHDFLKGFLSCVKNINSQKKIR